MTHYFVLYFHYHKNGGHEQDISNTPKVHENEKVDDTCHTVSNIGFCSGEKFTVFNADICDIYIICMHIIILHIINLYIHILYESQFTYYTNSGIRVKN